MAHFIDQQGAWDVWGDYWGILVADPPRPPDDGTGGLPRLPATCELYVDGDRVADTAGGLLAGDPTALDGLTVSWGRSTTVDQPDVSTCSFTVRDPVGSGALLSRYYTGAQVTVWASARTYDGTGTTDFAVDGGFETTEPVTARALGTGLAYTATASTGARALSIYDPSAPAADIPPAPFSASVTAWDSIPTVTPGEHWSISLDIRPPPGAGTGAGGSGVDLSIVSWSGPAATYALPLHDPAGAVTELDLGGGWWRVTARGNGADLEAGRWLGARVAMAPDGLLTWSEAAGAWSSHLETWRTFGLILVDRFQLIAPNTVQRRVLVWTGRITNLTASPDLGGGLIMAASAADIAADLANRVIGDDPWPAETVATRFARVLALAGVPIVDVLDPVPAALEMGYQDVDAADAWSLLADLADSTGAVLWPATHATLGGYLFLEDVTARSTSIRLDLDPTSGAVIVLGVAPDAGDRSATVLSACDILAAPITWVTDVSDRITTIDLSWQDQTLDGDGLIAPTERHILVADTGAADRYGVRRMSLSTQLTSGTAAAALASRILAQHDTAPWRMLGVRWDTGTTPATSATINDLADLLDGTTRLGRRVMVTDLPNYAPLAGDGPHLAAYLEGGTYAFADGAWSLDLNLNPIIGLGASVSWDQVPATLAWSWSDFPPALSWRSLFGVAGPV